MKTEASKQIATMTIMVPFQHERSEACTIRKYNEKECYLRLVDQIFRIEARFIDGGLEQAIISTEIAIIVVHPIKVSVGTHSEPLKSMKAPFNESRNVPRGVRVLVHILPTHDSFCSEARSHCDRFSSIWKCSKIINGETFS